MKIILFLLTFLSSNLALAVCSHNMTKTVVDEMKAKVYLNESIALPAESESSKMSFSSSSSGPFPDINDVEACLVSWSKYIAPITCSKLLLEAMTVKSNIGDFISLMNEQEVLFYYNLSFDATSSDGGFINEVYVAPVGESVPTYVNSYDEYFQNILDYNEDCAQNDDAVVYRDPSLNTTGEIGIATVTVYNSLNKQECKFIVNLKSKDIDIKVPSEYNFCVSNKENYIVTEIVWKDLDGLLQNEYGVGGVDDFVTEERGPAKVTTSSSSEIKNTIEVLFEAIEADEVLDVQAMASSVSEPVDFNNIASLDQDILRLGYLCDWGGYTDQSDANFDADYNDYLFYLNDTTDAPSASPLFPTHASWYRYIYNTVLHNATLYPAVLELLNNFKAGAITDEDISNWDEASGAYYLCYAQYQSSWWDAPTINAITGQ